MSGPTIYVDADACPVKDEVLKVADRLGLPVVFVDSLPYLWTANDMLPLDADIYCAQMCYALPSLCWPVMRTIQKLRWVEAIVPQRRRGSRGGGGAVVNVGGLHSLYSAESGDRYARCVLPAVLTGIQRAEVPVTAVCGNFNEDLVRMIREHVPESTSVGRLLPHEFNAAVGNAEVLFTSPGSTTILQADALGVPFVLLPPQNVSQILNAEWLGPPGNEMSALRWPAHLFDLAELEEIGRASCRERV